MKNKRNLLEKLFMPEQKMTEKFNSEQYIRDLEGLDGKFRDKFCLGVLESAGGTWNLQDFTQSPNALFVGAMGSGKSVSARFSVLTWLLANSDKTVMFIVDVLKGAQDYKPFFGLDQVYPAISGLDSEVYKVIDLMYEEMQKRNEMFKKVGANNIKSYEEATGKTLARVVGVFEEFHAIPYNILNFDKDYKDKNTPAGKFFQIMRVGRAMGVWILACSQKSTKSDIPSEIVTNFNQKQIFKVSKAEATYVLNTDEPSKLKPEQKGRCYTDYGAVQFPLVTDKNCKKFLDKYWKPNSAECFYLSHDMIENVLSGRGDKSEFEHKSSSELLNNLDKYPKKDLKTVISLFFERIPGCEKVNKVDALESREISHITHWHEGSKVAVMVKNEAKSKVSEKNINRLIEEMIKNNCDKGILIVNGSNLPHSTYRKANENYIELLDTEDLMKFIETVELTKQRGIERKFDPDKLASDDKESGQYQESHNIKDQNISSSKLEMIDPLMDMANPEIDDNDDFFDLDEEGEPEKSNDENVLPFNQGDLDNNEDEIDLDDLGEEILDFLDDNDDDEYGLEIKQTNKKEDLMNIKSYNEPKEQDLEFKYKSEDYPLVLVNCLRNSDKEIYRLLIYTVMDNKVVQTIHIDKEVQGDFSFIQKKKLGIASTVEWNSKVFTLKSSDFFKILDVFIKNFDVCDNLISIHSWKKDVDFITDYILNKSKNFTDEIITYEEQLSYIHLNENRDDLIDELGLKTDQKSIFAEIALDYQILTATL